MQYTLQVCVLFFAYLMKICENLDKRCHQMASALNSGSSDPFGVTVLFSKAGHVAVIVPHSTQESKCLSANWAI